MEKLKIAFVKFYQGVNLDQVTNVTSAKNILERTAQNPKLVSLDKTENGVLVTTEDQTGRICLTEVPYNNVAYINYEPTQKSERVPTKATAMKPSKASSEQS